MFGDFLQPGDLHPHHKIHPEILSGIIAVLRGYLISEQLEYMFFLGATKENLLLLLHSGLIINLNIHHLKNTYNTGQTFCITTSSAYLS